MYSHVLELAFGALVFLLPCLILNNDVSIWDVVPKVQVYRFPLIAQEMTWSALSILIASVAFMLFLIFLELRKRNLDDLEADVMELKEATDNSLGKETARQKHAGRVCYDMLNTSAEHYENLALLEQDLRNRTKPRQCPPTIELSLYENLH